MHGGRVETVAVSEFYKMARSVYLYLRAKSLNHWLCLMVS
jgi:hypothetical protein